MCEKPYPYRPARQNLHPVTCGDAVPNLSPGSWPQEFERPGSGSLDTNSTGTERTRPPRATFFLPSQGSQGVGGASYLSGSSRLPPPGDRVSETPHPTRRVPHSPATSPLVRGDVALAASGSVWGSSEAGSTPRNFPRRKLLQAKPEAMRRRTHPRAQNFGLYYLVIQQADSVSRPAGATK